MSSAQILASSLPHKSLTFLNPTSLLLSPPIIIFSHFLSCYLFFTIIAISILTFHRHHNHHQQAPKCILRATCWMEGCVRTISRRELCRRGCCSYCYQAIWYQCLLAMLLPTAYQKFFKSFHSFISNRARHEQIWKIDGNGSACAWNACLNMSFCDS